MEESRGIYGVLVGKPDRKRPLGRHRCKWENSFKITVLEVRCGSMDWIDVAQDRERWWALVNAIMSFGFHKGEFLD
jgi:hypothetical protein